MRVNYGLVWVWMAYAGAHLMWSNWLGFAIGLGTTGWYAHKVRREMDQQIAQALRS